ncbi:MAG: patatin-like phospholipase family protein [Sulfurimonadaceae bacterium]|nr:patatin-like phospholipase family protein [Sulfurimonadaceae bacterium]
MKNRTVSLVLGSGGARGLAHIGVIRWLEANGFVIKSVSGASMGALVGGIYAAGKLDEYAEWVSTVSKMDVFKLLDLSLSKDGLVKGDRIIETLKEFIGEWEIEKLPVRFTAVAADIEEEKEIWITEGSLFEAIRASISIPMFFTPYELNERLMIDGGVLNPVPIAPTFQDFTDITIAVNLAGDEDPTLDLEAIKEEVPEGASKWRDKIVQFIENLNPMKSKDEELEWSAYDIASHSIDMMQGTIARQKLAAYPPDYLVEIPRNACGMLEFDLSDKMIALGVTLAQEQLGHLVKET